MRVKKPSQENIATNGEKEQSNKVATRRLSSSSTYEPARAVKRCEAIIPDQNGGEKQCARIALKGKKFCHIHMPELTPKIEAIKRLLIEQGASFFTNNDMVSQVSKILSANQSSKLTRIIDKEFIELVSLLRNRALKDRLRFQDKEAWKKEWTKTIKNSITKWEQIRKVQSREKGFIPYAKYKKREGVYDTGSN
jgi:hypothetical protein